MDRKLSGFERARTLFDDGRYGSAYLALAGAGNDPISMQSRTTSERLLLGRLLRQLGAPRRGTASLIRTWRRDRDDPEATYHHARNLLALRGPDAALDFMRRCLPPGNADPGGAASQASSQPDAEAEVAADWVSLHGFARAQSRDFDEAQRWLERAREMRPLSPWLAVERSFVLELDDRMDEALREARFALALSPRCRPAIQQCAALMFAMGEVEEARLVLEIATRTMESAETRVQLAHVLVELGEPLVARRQLRYARNLLPLAEPEQLRWLDGIESDAAYLGGDRCAAIALARSCASPFHTQVADSMASADVLAPDEDAGKLHRPPCADRVHWRVPFVRQRRFGCAPAAVSMLTRYWDTLFRARPDSLIPGEAGTPPHEVRAWIESAGWVTRELTLDLPSAISLLDRGFPFALTTYEDDVAHMRVVVGYDTCRQTLLLRDPAEPEATEIPWLDLRNTRCRLAPRALVLAPIDRAPQLLAMDLPEADLHDLLYKVQCSLARHDLDTARSACSPDHPLSEPLPATTESVSLM